MGAFHAGRRVVSRKPSTTLVACRGHLEILFGRNVTRHGTYCRLAARNAFGTLPAASRLTGHAYVEEETMDGIIYLVGLIVIIMFILSIFGLR